jgi:hypothetical protein
VESICRRFCDEKRARLAWLRSEGAGFCAWWRSLRGDAQQALMRGVAGGAILKGLVRQFFDEKEVTSTLVMDALFCGCKQLDRLGRGQVGAAEACMSSTRELRGGCAAQGLCRKPVEVLVLQSYCGCCINLSLPWLPSGSSFISQLNKHTSR